MEVEQRGDGVVRQALRGAHQRREHRLARRELRVGALLRRVLRAQHVVREALEALEVARAAPLAARALPEALGEAPTQHLCSFQCAKHMRCASAQRTRSPRRSAASSSSVHVHTSSGVVDGDDGDVDEHADARSLSPSS